MLEFAEAIEAVGFPVIVAYLLYERTRFNTKIVEGLKEMAVTLKNVNDHIIGRF